MDKRILKNLILRYALTITFITVIIGGCYIFWKPILIKILTIRRWSIYVILAIILCGAIYNAIKKPYKNPYPIPKLLSRIVKEPESEEKEIFIRAEDLFQKSIAVIISIALVAALIIELVIRIQ